MMVLGCLTVGRGQLPDPPGQVGLGEERRHETYFFAYMMQGERTAAVHFSGEAKSLVDSDEWSRPDWFWPTGVVVEEHWC